MKQDVTSDTFDLLNKYEEQCILNTWDIFGKFNTSICRNRYILGNINISS